jgi:predicted P-loop ATPase
MSFQASSVRTPCPVCGRTSSGCRIQGELLQCRIGNTCSPFQKHPDLKLGDTVGQWACVNINEDHECVSFKINQERTVVKTTRYDYFNIHGDRITKTRLDFNYGPKEFKSPSYRLAELLPLYYELLKDLPAGSAVYIAEGEACAAALRERGFDAIGLPGTTYEPRELEYLRDKRLVFCPDRDRVGVEFMKRWAAFYGGGLWLLSEPHNTKAWRDPSDGFDLADWLPDVADLGDIAAAIRREPPELPAAPWWERINIEKQPKMVKIAPTELATCIAEGLGDSLRWNLLYDAIELDGKRPEDHDVRNFYLDIGRQNIQTQKQTAIDCMIYAARQRQYHPVRDYLDSCNDPLPQNMWDNIGQEFLGGHPEPYDNSIVQRWLVHAVRRVYEPGSPFGILLVLVGKQEAGKSRFFEELASRDWFNDGFKLTGDEADDIQKLTQTWIAEWGELDGGLKKSNEADIKAFITRKVDRTREAYGTGTCRRDRGFVMCGTTNKESGFFSDETGNRRFALYHVSDDGIDGEKVRAWRDRIWASAKRAYLNGMSIHLTADERSIQQERNRLMFREDPWITKIDQFLSERPHIEFVTATELLHNELCIGAKVDRSTSHDQNRVKVALTSLGWKESRGRRDGKSARGFRRPL